MTFRRRSSKIERLLRGMGFVVERRRRNLRVRTPNFRIFSRRQHDAILEVADYYGAKVSFNIPIYIHKREDG